MARASNHPTSRCSVGVLEGNKIIPYPEQEIASQLVTDEENFVLVS